MKTLIVEDDVTLRGFVTQALLKEDFSVDQASNAATAFELLAKNRYDLVLLDIMMPGLDGYATLQAIRQSGNTAAVFMLTAQSEEENKLLAFDYGADDYIVKPFLISELLARIRAWMRRRQQFVTSDVNSTLLTVGDLRLDVLKHQALRAGKRLSLSRKEFELLQYLMQNAGRVLSRADLQQHVWNMEYDATSTIVESHMDHLRHKVDEGHAVALIQPVRGSGYKIETA
jgi:two-component system, OmpR family, copper resistance phosphate regulon response regulator CusR